LGWGYYQLTRVSDVPLSLDIVFKISAAEKLERIESKGCPLNLWLTLVILATQETEFRRIKVQGQPRQIIHETLS
jgi:hypothetical protein